MSERSRIVERPSNCRTNVDHVVLLGSRDTFSLRSVRTVPGTDPCGSSRNDDGVPFASFEQRGSYFHALVTVDTESLEWTRQVVDRDLPATSGWQPLDQVEVAARFSCLVEDGYRVAAFGSQSRQLETRRAGANDSYLLLFAAANRILAFPHPIGPLDR